jgi:hypothetical protein
MELDKMISSRRGESIELLLNEREYLILTNCMRDSIGMVDAVEFNARIGFDRAEALKICENLVGNLSRLGISD